MRPLAIAGLLCCSAVAQLSPTRSTVRFAWDASPTPGLPSYALLWGTNRFEAGTNLTAAVSLDPGLHRVTAVVVINGLGSDPSNELRIRTILFDLESSLSPDGPWTNRQTFSAVLQETPATEFYRVRVRQ